MKSNDIGSPSKAKVKITKEKVILLKNHTVVLDHHGVSLLINDLIGEGYFPPQSVSLRIFEWLGRFRCTHFKLSTGSPSSEDQ